MAASSFARFDIWVAALSSTYTPASRFVAWADRTILADALQPRWVLDLSLSRGEAEALGVLWREWSRRSDFLPNDVPRFEEPGELYLGFRYLDFSAGRLPVAELLYSAGRYADGQGNPSPISHCGVFFGFLNEIEGRGPPVTAERPLADRIDELFSPYATAARAALRELPDDTAE